MFWLAGEELLPPPHPMYNRVIKINPINAPYLRFPLARPRIGMSTIPKTGHPGSSASPNVRSEAVLCPPGGSTRATVRAVVAMLTVIAAGLVLLRVMGLGVTVQLEATGAPEQLNCTAPEKPPLEARLRLNVAVAPAATVVDDGDEPVEIVKVAGALTVNEMACGLSAASSVMMSDPVRTPEAVGENVT